MYIYICIKKQLSPLTLCWEEVHMMADGLLHCAFECWVGGADGQKEMFGAGLPLRKKPLIPPHFPIWSNYFLHCFPSILLLSS